jgi:hypothetical protein
MLGYFFERGGQDRGGIGMSCGERPDREKSTIPPISTKRKSTSQLKPINTIKIPGICGWKSRL